MINRIKKLFSGYSSVTKKVNGRSYRFRYSDKPIYFDPAQMISEIKRIEETLISKDLGSSENFETLQKRLPDLKENDSPTVICEFKSSDKKLSVFRFSLKVGVFPVSKYVFEEDQIVIGEFCRIYDYGAMVDFYLKSLDPDYVENDPNVNSWKWQSSNGAWFMIEKFGHTQLWCWKDELKKV